MKIERYVALALGAVSAVSYAKDRPNIIYIMCDDMGYGDLGCYGQQYISTPHIDKMASEGMRFTQAYSGSPVSAPSRACFMTGQHSGHTHVRGNLEYWGRQNLCQNLYGQNADYTLVGQEPYTTEHVIIPEIFKHEGYTTALFGKWAGGYEGSRSVPETRGIDQFYGYICQFQAHLYYPNFLNRYDPLHYGDTVTVREVMDENIHHPMSGEEYGKRTQYSADIIHQHAMKWLDEQTKDKPFIGIFTYTIPHAELRQLEDSIYNHYVDCFKEDKVFGGNNGARYNATRHAHAQFAGMISRLDSQVGEILELLKRKGLEDNTVVIFTSDNGPHEEGGADPTFFNRDGLLRGIKRATYEGGIRIPFIVKWPAKVKAGQVNDHPFAFYDLMATFCDIAGIRKYEKKFRNKSIENDYFDGISIYPTLIGDNRHQKHHDHLYWEFHETDMIGVRQGDWKLVVRRGKCELYNLASDLHEDHNVASEHPDIVDRLVKIVYDEHRDPDPDVKNAFNITLPER